MRIAVITCDAFRDAWAPFTALFAKFWPDCPYPVTMHSDRGTASWCTVVLECANASNEPVLLLQEDFFMSQPVRQSVVEHGLRLMMLRNAGALRLYPSVGGSDDIGDPYFAAVPRGTRYRLSCQASIWKPEYLAEIARRSMETTSEAGDFENLGGPQGDLLPEEVLAFKRDVTPWPFEYIATAIVRGKWNPDALKLCAEYGIAVDTSRRPIAA